MSLHDKLALLDEIAILRAGLEGIAKDPHADFGDAYHNANASTERSYQCGIVDGHRCAADKANACLKSADAVTGEK